MRNSGVNGIAELMSKRAEENKDKIINKQAVQLKRYLIRQLNKQVRLGYTEAEIYSRKYYFTRHFEASVSLAKNMLCDEGFLMCFNCDNIFREPYFFIKIKGDYDD